MRNLLSKFKHFFQGNIIGGSELVPGVSGSNFAMIMGIYDDYIIFLDKLTGFLGTLVLFIFRKKTLEELKVSFNSVKWFFGITLLLGMFIASVVFSNSMKGLLTNYPNFVYALFFGLVAGSVIVPWTEMKNRKMYHYVIMLVTGILCFILFGLRPNTFEGNPPALILFLAGVVGTVGAILPGISGPFLLLLLGLYDFIIGLLASITTLQFSSEQLQVFILYFAGQLIGLVTFIKLVKWMLKKFPDAFMAFLVGVIIASLRIMYPWFDNSSGDQVLVSPFEFDAIDSIIMVSLIFLGLFIVVMAGKLGADRKQVKKIVKI